MKRRFIKSVMLYAAFLFLESFGGNPQYPSGSPGGYTGSPADGHNCTNCHSGSAINVVGWITSNVPSSGYVGGVAYTISVNVSGSGAKGFEVSPQTQAGALVGTLTAGSGTHLTNGNKSVTHTNSSNANPKIWTFTWTAPAAGTGPVTFYGAMIVSKLNTKLSTLVIQESSGVGIQEMGIQAVNMYPNPCIDVLYITGLHAESEVNLYSMNGKFVKKLIRGMTNKTEKIEISRDIPTGIYLVELMSGNERRIEKLIIR